jgi:pyruvate,water dikinase
VTGYQPLLHGVWDDQAYWSSANMAEAIPGVVSPLNWSVWGPVGERIIRWGFHAIGALEAEEVRVPQDPADRLLAIFHGRPAAKVDYFCAMGDRIPGASGAMIAEQYLGWVPDGLQSRRTARRYPVVAVKLPRLFVNIPGRTRDAAAITDSWWRAEVARANALDLDGARRMVGGGVARFELSLRLTAEGAFAGAQPVYDQIARLAETAGAPELAGKVVSGHGSHVETRVVADLWELSRGRLQMAAFLDRHGYHGPLEGEVSARVWREDPEPVASLARRYAGLDEADSPVETARRRAAEGQEAERVFMAALPRSRRPAARAVLRLARIYLPLRGIAKIPFLQALDVIRAGARRAGVLLADAGHLEHPDDVFYLTVDELLAEPTPAWRELVAARRAERASYEGFRLPASWHGRPEPERVESVHAQGGPTAEQAHVELRGIPASPGVAEGPVRVVTDPSFADIAEGEILVATTTDPSWASVMFFSSALVVDIGGALSHAAVVARELGVPCVMGVGRGTQVLRTGDICRVDGTRGTVELIKPSEEPDPVS